MLPWPIACAGAGNMDFSEHNNRNNPRIENITLTTKVNELGKTLMNFNIEIRENIAAKFS